MKKCIFSIAIILIGFSCNRLSKKSKDLNFICIENAYKFNLNLIDSLSKNENKLFKYKVNENAKFYKTLKTKLNFYDMYYYSKINDSTYVMYYSYDYSKTLLLLSLTDAEVKNFRELAYISGDGGDFDFKKTIYKNGVFYSDFIGGERTFTTPKDTIRYRYKGASKMHISSNGSFLEDTILLKKNFIEVKPEGYEIESNY
jgi:hypothetical protein